MREFMTKVSDYINEWREDPERRENRLSVVVIGVAAVVIIVLLLLLLWWGYSAQEKRKEEAAKRAAELQAARTLQDSRKEQDSQKERDMQEAGMEAVTREERMAEYMSMDSGEELRREYLTNTNALAEKIKELQSAMEQAQREIATIVKEYQGGDKEVTEKLAVLEKGTETVVKNIGGLELKMEKLSETIQTLDAEKIPTIQEQIRGLQSEIEQTRTDMAGVREKIKALEREDRELWKRLSEVEKDLEKALGENMKEIDKRLDRLGDDVDDLEREFQAALEKMNQSLSEKMDIVASEALAYRYEEETNTLYLMPNREKSKE